jgi:HK97 family phage major capsid protein
MEQKAADHGLAARKHIGPSPYLMSDKQLRDIYAAGRSNMSFGTTIGKGAEGNMGLVDKTVSEGAVGSLLPPILLPNAFPLRLEPVRIAEYFPAINAEGQAITFLQHQGNTLAASGAGMSVAENATKPELGMTLEAVTVPFTVVAAVETISKQLWTDFESVAEFLPREISNQVIQGENYQILSGSGTAPDQTGLLNVAGIQTRAFATGGSDTEIDTILEAANDIRVGAAYANADLVILNPKDWLSLRQLKTTFNSYVLKQNDPGELGGIDHLFQLRVAQTTSMPQGEALVLDTSIAVNVFRRWGLTVEVNPWAGTEFVANQLIVRAETRFGVGAIYPKAICKLTGLFP